MFDAYAEKKTLRIFKEWRDSTKTSWCDANAKYRCPEVRLSSVACIKVKDLGYECEGLGPEEMQIKLISCLVHTEL
jgi:hypothetical protein